VVVGLVEFLGGLALLLGLLARYAAALLSIVMLVAMLRVHLPKGFFLPDGIEYTLALLGANISLLLSGAGEFALDRYLERLWHPERRPA
jgi:putative oxidoreductase